MQQRTIELALDGGLGGDEGGRVQIKRLGDKAFRNAKRGEVWEFSPTGICEPLEVRITSASGVIEVGFDPLTACAVKKNVSVKLVSNFSMPASLSASKILVAQVLRVPQARPLAAVAWVWMLMSTPFLAAKRAWNRSRS